MKKIFALSMLIIAMQLICGCQATPEQQSVVSKKDGSFTSALYETQPDMEPESSKIQFATKFTSTDGSILFNVNLNQTLEMEKMPVIEVSPHCITSEDLERVAKSLLGDIDFYEREPSSNPRYSKSQYRKMIMRLAPYSNLNAMKDLFGADNAEGMLELIKDEIAMLTDAMELAPEDSCLIPCDWTFKKERVYNDTEWDIGDRALEDDDNWLVATAEKGELGYTYLVIARDQKDYKLNRFSIQLGGASVSTYLDRQIYWSKLCRTGAPTEQEIQSVQEVVMGMLEKMNLGQWQIADTQVETYSTGGEPEYMICINAVPMLSDIPVAYGQRNGEKSDDYTGAYAMTQATFRMSANGDLIEMVLDSPVVVETIPNKNVARLSFSQLIERAQQHLSLSDAGNFGVSTEQLSRYEEYFKEDIRCYVNVSRIDYELARIMIEDTNDSYYYVPAMTLWGNIQYCGESSGTVYSDISDKILLCINTMDGSIIS